MATGSRHCVIPLHDPLGMRMLVRRFQGPEVPRVGRVLIFNTGNGYTNRPASKVSLSGV